MPTAEHGPAHERSNAAPTIDHTSGPPGIVVERADSESVVHLRGEVDLYNAGELRRCLEDLASSGQERVVLDLEQVDFIDSSGLGAMVRGMRRIRQAGGELVLRHPKDRTAKILEISGLRTLLAVEV